MVQKQSRRARFGQSCADTRGMYITSHLFQFNLPPYVYQNPGNLVLFSQIPTLQRHLVNGTKGRGKFASSLKKFCGFYLWFMGIFFSFPRTS